MSKEEKKAYILLLSTIFHYHGLNDSEKKTLDVMAKKLDAQNELTWANAFIAEDFFDFFDRARTYLNNIIGKFPKKRRIQYAYMAWNANLEKGFATELEAVAIFKLAKDWKVEKELTQIVKAQIEM